MTVFGVSPADSKDQENFARAAGVTFSDRFALRFRHSLSGSWSDWLWIKTRDFFCQDFPPHCATEKAWEAGISDMNAAQLRQLAFLEAVELAGISLDTIEVEIIDFPAEKVIRDWQRAGR